ncbi:speckle-type POZ protein-like B [Nephila pilipes]|uniref:Speckle-type POZ protein-like B n=1 Tax=Nephila pilipes TaxID=299642 RepID=A0A8X6NUC0_NEPPI|nr:speckle-type POZ protein-like B [Nephila pilipes]
MACEDACVTLFWDIVNFSDLWKIIKCEFAAIEFQAKPICDTLWILRLFSNKHEGTHYFGYSLEKKRSTFRDNFELDFELAFLADDGTDLVTSKRERLNFQPGQCSKFFKIVKLEDILCTRRKEFLPRDILRTSFRMWANNVKTAISLKMFMRSVTETQCNSFIWNLYNFSRLRNDREIEYQHGLFFDLRFKSKNDEDKLALEINCKGYELRHHSLQFCIIDSKGNESDWNTELHYQSRAKFSHSLPLSLNDLIENKDLYLQNDTLSLKCEYRVITGVLYDSLERCEFRSVLSKMVIPSTQTVNGPETGEIQAEGLAKDIGSLLTDTTLCDTELRTQTETFPAHALILSTRSTLFRDMFADGLKEGIDITDLDDDTVRRMLLYIYTDRLDDLQWEAALKLYVAADSYEINCLQDKCCCFLMDNMRNNNVCEIMLFADQHFEEDLKMAAQDYVLEHAKDIFKSREWKTFMFQHVILAAETMYRNWEKD